MKLNTLVTKNFKVLRGERRFDFPEGIIGITGLNGRGKSTVPNAIAWALYGTDAIHSSKSDIATWGEKDAAVSLTFSTNDGEGWEVKRNLSNAELYHNGESAALGVDAVTNEVERILSLDRVGFLTSVYARQEELAGLMSLTPANRVKTVLRLLRLEQLSSAIDKVRADARDVKQRLDGIRSVEVDTNLLREEISSIDEDIDACLSEIEEYKERLSELEKERKSLVDQQAALIPQTKSFEEYRQKISKANIRVAQSESAMRYAERETLRPQPPNPGAAPDEVSQEEIENAMRGLNVADNEYFALKEQIATLQKSSVCSECGRPFDNREDVEEHIRELNLRLVDTAARRVAYKSLYDDLAGKYKAFSAWKQINDKFVEYEANLKLASLTFEKAASDYAQAVADRDSIQPVPDVTGALQALSGEILEAEMAGGQIRESLATLAERVNGLRSARENLLVSIARAEQSRGMAKKAEKQAAIINTAANELVKMKTEMIAKIIPELSDRSSRLVSEFTDGRYDELSLTPDYEIQYRNDIGEYKGFESLSGGEKDVFSLALRLAISDLRAGDIGLLMLDEVIESLDADRQEATWSAIERLTGRYNQILLITHVQAFKDRAATVISI